MKFTGKTTREAISKAVRAGRKQSSSTANDCAEIERGLQSLQNHLLEMAKQSATVNRQIQSLRRDQRDALARIGLDLSLMAFAAGRLLKAGRIVERIRNLLRSRDHMGQLVFVGTLVGELFGANDVVNLARSVRVIDVQVQALVQDYNATGQNMRKVDIMIQHLQQQYRQSSCRQAVQPGNQATS